MIQKQSDPSKIFLSHHSSKVELVEHLAKYLERNGLSAWYAPRNIHSGEAWDEAIHVAIRECRAVVLLFCAQADSSNQVKRELSLADKYKKPVFWLRIERVEPNNLSYFLTATQWLDWLDARDETLERLIYDIYSTSGENSDKPANRDIDAPIYQQPIINEISWAKGIIATPSDREAAECAARVYFSAAQQHPDSSVILPTGRSATMIFRAMTRIATEYNGCPFGETQIISDTETFGVWAEHDTSRTRHIMEMLIRPLQRMNKAPCPEQLHLLSGIYMHDDPIKDAQKILRLYPPIIHAVSVSPLGEILAYEVGTYNEIDEIIDDVPRIVEVGEHSKKYIDPNQPSKSIITIGLGTVMAAEILLVLILDMQKANILKRMFSGPITAGIPATLLRKHPNAFVLTTQSIAHEARIEEFVTLRANAKEAAEWITEQQHIGMR